MLFVVCYHDEFHSCRKSEHSRIIVVGSHIATKLFIGIKEIEDNIVLLLNLTARHLIQHVSICTVPPLVLKVTHLRGSEIRFACMSRLWDGCLLGIIGIGSRR